MACVSFCIAVHDMCVLIVLQDINPWFQFGSDGYTTPPATAHKGSCTYSAEHRLCPIPPGCLHRMPQPMPNGETYRGDDVCEEMDIRTLLGPLVAPPLKKKNKPAKA